MWNVRKQFPSYFLLFFAVPWTGSHFGKFTVRSKIFWDVSSKVLSAAGIKTVVFCLMTPYSLEGGYKCFREICYPSFSGSKWVAADRILTSTLKKDAPYSSETFVSTYKTTRYHSLNLLRCDHIFLFFSTLLFRETKDAHELITCDRKRETGIVARGVLRDRMVYTARCRTVSIVTTKWSVCL